jgi:excisionase family DNA binding protein
MAIQNIPPASPHALLTLEETAAFLKVSKSWIYERTRKGTMPHLKLGKYLRFPLADLLVWIAAHGRSAGQVPPASCTMEEAERIGSKRSVARPHPRQAHSNGHRL